MNFPKGLSSLSLPHYWRFVIPAFILTASFYFLLGSFWQGQQHQVPYQVDYHNKVDIGGHFTPPSYDGSDITVNLVIATLSKDDISWTQNIEIPNMHDFYDSLPDITIFTHADDSPWHVEGTLNSSLTFALSHLDLNEVLKRQYFNLRVSWENACPNWINTSKTDDDWSKQEEPYMHEAFSENFATNKVPEILAGPCCSQFAATREAVRRHPKSQYRINMDWLIQTHWNDYISGRVWEHMWPWLFIGKAVDCDVEWQAYCKMYHICFDPKSRSRLISLKEEKNELEMKTGLLEGLLDLLRGFEVRKRLQEINAILAEELEKALERGKDEAVRTKLLSDFNNS
ncbi:hypothetical protein F4805DRAFT_436523 [Annulohypoxylon moriforme]|nr:hypothetical protein F4805DRAFT_436523 [Annulohypoxylon moriforme]